MREYDNCHVDPMEKTLDRQALENAVAAYLQVGGMGCPNCACGYAPVYGALRVYSGQRLSWNRDWLQQLMIQTR